MTAEHNKVIARRFYELYNQGDWDSEESDQIIAADFIAHYAGLPEPLNRDAYKEYGCAFLLAFPDCELTIENMIAEGDKVAVRLTFRGTHMGELNGIQPTGKQVTLTQISILRVADGKAVEQWVNSDDLGMLQQLGIITSWVHHTGHGA